jgi:hypothetical protein
MMATSARRRLSRPQEAPSHLSRLPEWDRVAEVADGHLANLEQDRRIRKALADIRTEIAGAVQAVERCEGVVAAAAREEPRRLSAEALGQVFEGTAPALEVAEGNLKQAKRDLEHRRAVIGALEKELAATQECASHTWAQLRAAVREALAVYLFPAVENLYDQGRAQAECGVEIFRTLGPLRLPPALAYWDATNRSIPKVPPVAAMLTAAIEKLESGAVDEGLRDLDAAMVTLPTLD